MVPLVHRWLGIKCCKNAGAAAYWSTFGISCHVGKYFNNFDGDIATIPLVVDKLKDSPDNNLCFLFISYIVACKFKV